MGAAGELGQESIVQTGFCSQQDSPKILRACGDVIVIAESIAASFQWRRLRTFFSRLFLLTLRKSAGLPAGLVNTNCSSRNAKTGGDQRSIRIPREECVEAAVAEAVNDEVG